jgi:hypothetical protein
VEEKTMKFLDWCCGIHIRWRWSELLRCKCSSISYPHMVGVSNSLLVAFLPAAGFLAIEQKVNTKFCFKLGKAPTEP